MACAAAVLAVSREAEATFPGKNGKIAYVASGANDPESDIYTINAGGGGKTQITHNNTEDGDPSYSPNGKKIVYVRSDGNDSELYTIAVRTGHRVQLTHNHKEDFHPSYSPDGKRIAYTQYSDEGLFQGDAAIYTIAADGGREILITDNNGKGGLYPSWGPRP
jgi:Tol biopolymer transport system component